MGLIVWSHFHIEVSQRIKQIEDQKPDEEVIEEEDWKFRWKRKWEKENKKNRDDGSAKEGDGDHLGIANLEDDITNTWHHHYQVNQDQKGEQWKDYS